MQDELKSIRPETPLVAETKSNGNQQIKECCRLTIEEHVIHNKMMVCDSCKMLIKCYEEKGSYENYLKFCKSRKRKTLTGFYAGHHTIVFNPYSH